MQFRSRRRDGVRPATKLGAKAQQETSESAEANIVSNDLDSGYLGPGDVVVEVPPTQTPNIQNEKPWYTLRGFWTFVAHQRQKIPRRFRRNRAPARDAQVDETQESTVAPLLSNYDRTSSGKDQSLGSGHTVISTNAKDATYSNTMDSRGIPQLPLLDADATPSLDGHVRRHISNSTLRRGTAFLAEATFKDDVESGEVSVAEDHHATAAGGYRAMHDKRNSETQPAAGLERAREGSKLAVGSTSGSNLVNTTEELGHVYQPRPQKNFNSAEFVSSAVLVRNPAGEQDSVKLYYDTMSTDNIASQKFVDKYGFKKRPILPEDLKVYDTPTGVLFAPTHYVEIELRDTERGIKEFIKASFNIAESMGGPGLLVGQEFMTEHSIELSAKEGRGAYVLTSRKASEEAKKAQKLLLDQTAKAIEQAKGYATSSAGSTTTATGTNQVQKAADSSRTSNSTGSRNIPKK